MVFFLGTIIVDRIRLACLFHSLLKSSKPAWNDRHTGFNAAGWFANGCVDADPGRSTTCHAGIVEQSHSSDPISSVFSPRLPHPGVDHHAGVFYEHQ